MLVLIFNLLSGQYSPQDPPLLRMPSFLQSEKYTPPSVLTLHGLIKQSDTYDVELCDTADNRHHVVTVRGFTSDRYAK